MNVMAIERSLMSIQTISDAFGAAGYPLTASEALRIRVAMFDHDAEPDEWADAMLAKVLPPAEITVVTSEFPL
jgi:hypothetical protein